MYKKECSYKNQSNVTGFLFLFWNISAFIYSLALLHRFYRDTYFYLDTICLYFKHIDEKLELFLQAFKIFTTY